VVNRTTTLTIILVLAIMGLIMAYINLLTSRIKEDIDLKRKNHHSKKILNLVFKF